MKQDEARNVKKSEVYWSLKCFEIDRGICRKSKSNNCRPLTFVDRGFAAEVCWGMAWWGSTSKRFLPENLSFIGWIKNCGRENAENTEAKTLFDSGPWCRVGEAFRCGESNANVDATSGRLDKSTRRKVADHVEGGLRVAGVAIDMPINYAWVYFWSQEYRRSPNIPEYHCSFAMSRELQLQSIERSRSKKSI